MRFSRAIQHQRAVGVEAHNRALHFPVPYPATNDSAGLRPFGKDSVQSTRPDHDNALVKPGQNVAQQLASRGVSVESPATLAPACALYKDRCTTVVELADWIEMMFVDVSPSAEDLAVHVTDVVSPALRQLRESFAVIAWDKASIAAAMKEALVAHKLKMPQLAPALRVLVCGRAQTPSIDAVLALFSREMVLSRLRGI